VWPGGRRGRWIEPQLDDSRTNDRSADSVCRCDEQNRQRIGRGYERRSAVKLTAEYTRSPLVRDRIRADEVFDVVVTTQSRISELAAENKVFPDSAAALARSTIGIAVRQGRPKPDIASVGTFVATLRAAKSIACADPAFGTASGLYLVKLFDCLGLTAELKSKIRLVGAKDGKPVVVCAAVADGSCDLGLQQIAEIVSVPGVDLVGPLPEELQHVTVFSAAVALRSRHPDEARDFVEFLTAASSKAVVRKHGMEPV
jgi:molybdate transport system substrate-binding protein